MSFLYPAFLWAIAAVGVPVIIHLFNFRRYKKVFFTNVRFLQELKEETQSKQKLKHLIVLALRCLAIISLVFAFAQPYFKKQQTALQAGDNLVSVYVDNSFSMGAQGAEGELLEQAKDKARSIAKSYRSSDLFQLLTNDFEGRHQRMVSKEEFLKLVDEVKLSPLRRSLTEVVNRQKECLSNANGNKEVFWLSDFQRNASDLDALVPDSAVHIQVYALQPDEPQNVYVDSCWFETPYIALNQNAKLIVSIRNASDKDIENGSVTLKVNGTQKALAAFTVSRNATVEAEINFNASANGWVAGEVSINDHPITFDDRMFFSFYVDDHIPVLSINAASANMFITTVYESNPYFKLSQVSYRNINYDDLKNYKLIILNEVDDISSGMLQQLRQYVEGGGNVLVLPSSTVSNLSSAFNGFLQSMHMNSLDAKDVSKTVVQDVNTQNEVFHDVFEKEQKNMNLPEVFMHYTFSKNIVPGRDVLMTLKNGDPFLCKYPVGDGSVYLCASPFDAAWSELSRHALFVPLMYKLALIGNRQLPLYAVIGRDKEAPLKKPVKGGEDVLVLKSESKEMIPEIVNRVGSPALYADGVDHDGIYRLSPRSQPDTLMQLFAFNYNRSESDMQYLSGDPLGKALAAHNITYLNEISSLPEKALAGSTLRNELWKWFVVLTLVFLLGEILVLRFYNPTAKLAGS